MIITLASLKGGTGKTVLSLHLAHVIALAKHKVSPMFPSETNGGLLTRFGIIRIVKQAGQKASLPE